MLTTPTNDQLRNADLAHLAQVLKSQELRRHDVLVPFGEMKMNDDGTLVVPYSEPSGVDAEGNPTEEWGFWNLHLNQYASGQFAQKLDIPVDYWRRMFEQDSAHLAATNANHWLARRAKAHPGASLMLRTFLGDEAHPGYVRAVVSDRFFAWDNVDVLVAIKQGIDEAGISVSLDPKDGGGIDLTDQRMYLRIVAPEITRAAEDVLANYRSPFDGRTGKELPLISAGLVVTNSDVGAGAFQISPRIVVQVCRNGMTRAMDVFRKVHLGGTAESGVVDWSADTQEKRLAVIKAETRDAVTTFLSEGYIERTINEMRAAAGVKISEPEATIKVVAKKLAYTEAVRTSILDCFIKGGDLSALGVGQAVTAAAQIQTDPEMAAKMESDFFAAVSVAVASA